MADSLQHIADATIARWNLKRGKDHRDYTREEVGKILDISIGLGALFNEDVKAECAWMNSHSPKLGMTPVDAILNGKIDKVVILVRKARNL